MLDAAIRDRNDKAWNRAAAELAEAEFMLTIATSDVAEAQKELDVVNAEITTLNNTLTQQKKNLTASDTQDNRNAVDLTTGTI